MTLVPAGPDYCRTHSGIREEDEQSCDFLDPYDPDHDCPTCDGMGGLRNPATDSMFECPDCVGVGTTPCDLTPLLYENGKTT